MPGKSPSFQKSWASSAEG